MAIDGRIARTDAQPETLASAPFVRIIARPDGDAIAASAIVADALATVGTPFQVSVDRTLADRSNRCQECSPNDVAFAVGPVDSDVPGLEPVSGSLALAAHDLAAELGVSPDPITVLAGVHASGCDGDADAAEDDVVDDLWTEARDRELLDQRPGVAIPVADPIDGLAHSTSLRAPWSGDTAAVAEALAGVVADDVDLESIDPSTLDADDWRSIGSLVAIDAVSAPNASTAGANALATLLHPAVTPAGPLETVGGYADVLAATARLEPGTGIALGMGHDVSEAALAVWREHGRRTHEAIDAADRHRCDGVLSVTVDTGPIESVARLVATYESPEPVVLAIGEGEAAVEIRGDSPEETTRLLESIATALTETIESASDDFGARRGYVRYDETVDAVTVRSIVEAEL